MQVKHNPLLASVLLHHQDLHHADEDVKEVKLERDTLVDGVTAHDTSLGETGVVQNLLDIVEGEATEDGKTTVEPDALSESESSESSGGKDQRGKTRGGNNCSTSQERTTNVEVLLLLSSGTDKSKTTHHGDGVETSTAQDSRRNEGEERGDKSGLGGVEGGPESVLGDIAINLLVKKLQSRH
jgi:hypothetical protein